MLKNVMTRAMTMNALKSIKRNWGGQQKRKVLHRVLAPAIVAGECIKFKL